MARHCFSAALLQRLGHVLGMLVALFEPYKKIHNFREIRIKSRNTTVKDWVMMLKEGAKRTMFVAVFVLYGEGEREFHRGGNFF